METVSNTKPVTIQTFGRINVAHLRATHQQSMEFAKARGGRLLSKGELIAETNRSPEFSKAVLGPASYFFLIEAKGTKLSDHQRIDNKSNCFIPVKQGDWKKLPFRDRGFAWKGNARCSPLSIVRMTLTLGCIYLGTPHLPLPHPESSIWLAHRPIPHPRTELSVQPEQVAENAGSFQQRMVGYARKLLRM